VTLGKIRTGTSFWKSDGGRDCHLVSRGINLMSAGLCDNAKLDVRVSARASIVWQFPWKSESEGAEHAEYPHINIQEEAAKVARLGATKPFGFS
jgi:hypothetical protein